MPTTASAGQGDDHGEAGEDDGGAGGADRPADGLLAVVGPCARFVAVAGER